MHFILTDIDLLPMLRFRPALGCVYSYDKHFAYCSTLILSVMAAQKGFHRSNLNQTFFTSVANGMGVELVTWEEAEMPKTDSMASEIEKGGSSNAGLKGIFKFKILGKDGHGVERWRSVIIKSKGKSKDSTDSWAALFKPHGEEMYAMAKQYHHLVMGNTNAAELMVQAARLVYKDAFFARYRPTVYHTLLDQDAGISVVVMDYVSSEDVLVGGALEYKDWTCDFRKTVLKEIALFHAHFMNEENMATVAEQFQGILERHPQRHLRTLPYIREALKFYKAKDPQFTAERCQIIRAYADHLEEITKEEEAYPMTLVHNDFHNGRHIPFMDSSPLSGI